MDQKCTLKRDEDAQSHRAECFIRDWGGVKLKRTFITLFARLKRSSVSSRWQMETFKGSLFLLNLSKTFSQTWNNGNIEVWSSSFITSSPPPPPPPACCLWGGYKQAVDTVTVWMFHLCCWSEGHNCWSEGHNCLTSGPKDETKGSQGSLDTPSCQIRAWRASEIIEILSVFSFWIRSQTSLFIIRKITVFGTKCNNDLLSIRQNISLLLQKSGWIFRNESFNPNSNLRHQTSIFACYINRH